MGHSLSRTNLTIKDLFIKDGGETANYILVSDAKGMANWKKPSNYIADKPNDHYIGELFGGGVVVAVWQENGIEKCLIAGPENINTVRTIFTRIRTAPSTYANIPQSFLDYGFQWGSAYQSSGSSGGFDPSITSLLIGASYSSFGASNSTIIGNYTSSDPLVTITDFAAERCLDYYNPNLGTGIWDDWFLPAIYELNHLINNAAIFNKVLESFASDSGRPIKDVVNNQENYDYFNDVTYFNTTSFTQTDINLVELDGTKYTTNTTPLYGGVISQTTTSNDYTPPAVGSIGDGAYYLSSTEYSRSYVYGISTSPYIYTTNPSTGLVTLRRKNTLNLEEISKELNGSVRPFRIADDTQKSFVFDADYLVISYQFTDGRDLDTRTRMISPTSSVTPWNPNSGYVDGVNGGPFSSNSVGWSSPRPWTGGGSNYDYTPGVTTTIPAPVGRYNLPGFGNNLAGTYSILRSAGDNLQTGFESIIVSTDAFRHHFPGQSEIVVDCRAWWQGSKGFNPVVLNVVMYKGGQMIRKNNIPPEDPGGNSDYFVWINPTAGASYSIDSYGKTIPSPLPITSIYPGDNRYSERVGKLKYNVVGKFGYLIID
jgi:hypothetical protein